MKLGRRRTISSQTINGKGVRYLLRDLNSDDHAAGSLNATFATDGNARRSVIDSMGTKISNSGGKCVVSSVTTATSDPLLSYDRAITRIPGLFLSGKVKAAAQSFFGFGVNKTSYPNRSAIGSYVISTTVEIYDNGNVPNVSSKIVDTEYEYVIIFRSAGNHVLMKGGTDHPNMELVWSGELDTLLMNYVSHTTRTGGYTVDDIYIQENRFWLPTPVVSDGFGGVVGTTDGKGHPEGAANGFGQGGSGVSWIDRLGTWQNANGLRNASVLDGGGSAICTLNTTKADTNISVDLVRSAGNAGVIFRYVDANNYAYAYLLNDGANKISIHQVVAGSDTELMAPTPITYEANKKIRVHLSGNKVRVFYYLSLVGAEQTLNPALIGTNAGFYTTDTGNTFNNFQVWSRGTSGEYNNFISETVDRITTKQINVPDGADIASYVAQMSGGDTLNLAANGHYTLGASVHGFIGVPSGYPRQYSTIQGNGATVTGGIDGLNFGQGGFGTTKAYINVNSINFRDQTRFTITYDGCHHINQTNCTYSSTQNALDILKIYRSNDLAFTDCTVLPTVSSSSTCDGFEFWGPCNRILLTGCIAHGLNNGTTPNDGHGFEVYGETAAEICDNIRFINCTSYDNRGGFSCEGGASNLALHTNVICDNCHVSGGNISYDYGGIQGATINRINSPGTTSGNVIDL